MNSVHPAAPSSSPIARWSRFVVRRRRIVLAAYVVLLAVFGAVGFGVFPNLGGEGFDDPGSESGQVQRLLEDRYGVAAPVAVIVIRTDADVDDPAVADRATAVLDQMAATAGVAGVVSYWGAGQPPQLRGADGRHAQALVYVDPGADGEAISADLVDRFGGAQDGLEISFAGPEPVISEVSSTISSDLARAEAIAVPIVLLLLLWVFGSVVAAGLPFLVAIFATLGSFFLLFLATLTTDVSIFALNLVTALGLALGVDYALLMINRFREELARLGSGDEAVVAMMGTAGRTVLVSGLTVALTLASLTVFPLYFLRSFAYAGVAVSLMAVLGAFTGLPALLAMLGPRVNRLKLRRGDLAPTDEGAWSRVARAVMGRPWPVLIGCVAVLLVLAIPALRVVPGQVDDRALPPDNPAAQASQLLREQFPGEEGTPFEIVLRDADAAGVDAYAEAVAAVPGIVRVETPTSTIAAGQPPAPNPNGAGLVNGDLTRVVAVGDQPFAATAAVTTLDAIRALPAPASEVLVGGATASFEDANDSVVSRLWLVALWVGLTTLIVIFLYTGSILIPLKAILLNLLGLGATLGVLVWVFQDGHLRWLTGDFQQTGTLDLGSLVIVAIVAFALSTDYELFLLSRIKEAHDQGSTTREAVALGLQRTGRIVTAAAILIAIVFIAFIASGVTNIKQLGFGAAFAILIDATLVRGLLVPALMRIAGDANWWAPAWLRRVHGRIGLSD
ncbi:MAG: MMPL family transporter [Actinomycetota bacterium]